MSKKRAYVRRKPFDRIYRTIPIEEKFDRRIQMDGVTTCWYWAGNTNRVYGIIQHKKRAILAHRYAYERFVGPIPAGLEIDHMCRNVLCVNPRHLRAVTRLENMRAIPMEVRARGQRKPTCAKGHPYTEQSTMWVGSERVCRICRNAYQNARNRRLREQRALSR